MDALNSPPQAPPAKSPRIDLIALQAALVSHDHLRPAATALASEFATRLGCERVAIGFVEIGRAHV